MPNMKDHIFKHLTPIAVTVTILLLAGCAAHQPPQTMAWAPVGDATTSLDLALAKCRYDIVQDNRNFDQLFLLSGQPKTTASGGVQGLNQNGTALFSMCMGAEGYKPAGMVPIDSGK